MDESTAAFSPMESELKNPLLLVPPKVSTEALLWDVPLVGAIVIEPLTTKSTPYPRIFGLRHSPPLPPTSILPTKTFPFIVGVPLDTVYIKNLTESGKTRFSILRSFTSVKPLILY